MSFTAALDIIKSLVLVGKFYLLHTGKRVTMFPAGKGDPAHRLTYLLRPNVQKQDYGAAITLETPPATDVDYSSQFEVTDSDSDFVKDSDLIDLDIDHLNLIEEVSSSQQAPIRSISREDDSWSLLDRDSHSDVYGDESSSEAGQDLLDTVDSSLEDTQALTSNDENPDKTMTQDVIGDVLADSMESPIRKHHHQLQPLRLAKSWTRSTSPPSCPPACPQHLPSGGKKRLVANLKGTQRRDSFYDYLFT